MPVTPFHFGAGLLAKGVFPRQVSFVAFVVSQVVIDCETAYYMLIAREWPFHRWAHTFLVGGLVGTATGLAVALVARLWLARAPATWRGPDLSEVSRLPALVGGLLGGLSHAFLDGVMHDDTQPLWPFSDANPFRGLVSLSALHLGLVAAGVLGVVLLAVWAKRMGFRPGLDNWKR